MPVTAKLSRKFYDRLGEDIANELLEWFNIVDATYSADLREVNEINFARFEAKLDQKIEGLRSEMHQKIEGLRSEIHLSAAELKEVLERRLGEQTRWMFVAWSALLIPIFGLWFR